MARLFWIPTGLIFFALLGCGDGKDPGVATSASNPSTSPSVVPSSKPAEVGASTTGGLAASSEDEAAISAAALGIVSDWASRSEQPQRPVEYRRLTSYKILSPTKAEAQVAFRFGPYMDAMGNRAEAEDHTSKVTLRKEAGGWKLDSYDTDWGEKRHF